MKSFAIIAASTIAGCGQILGVQNIEFEEASIVIDGSASLTAQADGDFPLTVTVVDPTAQPIPSYPVTFTNDGECDAFVSNTPEVCWQGGTQQGDFGNTSLIVDSGEDGQAQATLMVEGNGQTADVSITVVGPMAKAVTFTVNVTQ